MRDWIVSRYLDKILELVKNQLNIIFANEKLVEELLDELKIHKQKIVIKKSQLDLN